MAFVIPETCTDWSSKLAYVTAAQEKLRLDFNSHGAAFNDKSLSQDDWDTYNIWFEEIGTDVNLALNALRQNPPDALMSQVAL